ncbi:Transcription factor BOA15 [Pseudocercospora fuligena]|uniref:Transcription factor BOA15 n=1 Tax=Pseudocercospora fuligena TaxID=685502 RepID=A0A8H6RNG0_9PEZI|nr:Transcription factor BOA15 [Pseudocercospora fuligena]
MTVPRELLWSDVVVEPIAPSRTEAEDIIRHFYATTHEWSPVISCRRITREMEATSEVASADFVALIFAMQLISTSGSEASQEAYHATKAALAACEQVNQMTTNYSGAYILIATFELGHAMFPTAYLSIAHCTRIFYALGTHDKKKATQLFGSCDTWVETEERRRLWWAAITLDRYAHILFRFRPLSVQHIPADEIIPANDDAWDGGELTVNALLVMSIEANTAVTPFARTCQAAHILGKACHHVNEVPTANDAELHLEEAVQIARATHALKTLIEQDSAVSDKPSRLFTARALCLSTQQLLFDVHSCIESDHVDSGGGNKGLRLELQQLAIDGSKTAAAECVGFAEELEAHLLAHGSSSISPMVLNALYSAAGTWAWYYRETGNQGHLDKLNGLRRILDTMQSQWHASIDYLLLLENTEFTYTGACYQ